MTDPYYNPTIPPHVPAHLVHDFNLFDPEYEDLDLFASVRRLHDIGLPEIFWTRNNGGHWVALRGAVIAEVARDAAHFSSKRMFVPDEQNFETSFFVPLMADPPDHAGYRSIVMPLFSPIRIKKLEAGIREFTGGLIDEIRSRRECELMADFALQMPIVVFLQLLDLPLTDRLRLLDIAARIVRPPPEGERRDDAMQQLFDYLRPILAERSANPGEDVLSKLVTATIEGRPLAPDEMLGLAATILAGGLDSVAATLGFFARYLAETPAARQRLIADPTAVVPAIDELIRRYPATTHGRHVAEDFHFHGIDMKKDEHIVWAAGMFNFDEEQFPDSMTVDFDRKRAAHLSFGTGIHFCVGNFLARAELRIFIEEWLKRIPDFRVKPGATIQYRPGINIAYDQLPLEWNV
jgi:cytochrome P450